MAALTMRDRKDVDAFITVFLGTNRYILDYLLEEVLSHQPPEIQRFPLYTSILERLTDPLYDALLVPSEVHLLALSRTNQEIACQLVVALGTIKAHAAKIYRKLDVANRTEAVAHAWQFGIHP